MYITHRQYTLVPTAQAFSHAFSSATLTGVQKAPASVPSGVGKQIAGYWTRKHHLLLSLDSPHGSLPAAGHGPLSRAAHTMLLLATLMVPGARMHARKRPRQDALTKDPQQGPNHLPCTHTDLTKARIGERGEVLGTLCLNAVHHVGHSSQNFGATHRTARARLNGGSCFAWRHPADHFKALASV